MTENEMSRPKIFAAPYVDIYERDESIMLVADMPGVDEKSANVVFENGVLTIEGDRPRTDSTDYSPVRLERRADVFRRTFEVSDAIDPAKITANMKQGVLTITLPRREDRKPRKIEIAAA